MFKNLSYEVKYTDYPNVGEITIRGDDLVDLDLVERFADKYKEIRYNYLPAMQIVNATRNKDSELYSIVILGDKILFDAVENYILTICPS